MKGKTKPISLEETCKIEMKNDGHDLERFQNILKNAVNIPRKEANNCKGEKTRSITDEPSQNNGTAEPAGS